MWVLYLNSNGTVKTWKKFSNGNSGCGTSKWDNYDYFGYSIASLGDFDGAGPAVSTIAVGAPGDDDGNAQAGAVWLLYLQTDGTLLSTSKISDIQGMGGILSGGDEFGTSIANLGDLDGDGIVDLVVGAAKDDTGGNDTGAVYVVFLNASGGVKAQQKISVSDGGFDGVLETLDGFARSVAAPGDLNGDGIQDVIVGSYLDDDGGADRGSVWVLYLNRDGTVKYEQKISSTEGGFTGPLDDGDHFGGGVAGLGDHDGDGLLDIMVGVRADDDGGQDRGAVYTLFSDFHTPASAVSRNPNVGGFTNPDVYSVTSLPVVGGTLSASIALDAGQNGGILAGYSAPLSAPSGWGNILVDIFNPNGELLGMPMGLGNPAVIDLAVPPDVSFIGFEVATQAIRIGSGLDLTNAQDLQLGW